MKFTNQKGTRFSFLNINILIITVALVAIYLSGCFLKKSPEAKNSNHQGTISVENNIFSGGFYLVLDKGEAVWFDKEIKIPASSGKHSLIISNKETTIGQNTVVIEHQFKFKFKLKEREAKKIVLSWDLPEYSRKEKGESSRKKTKKKGEPGFPGDKNRR